MYDIAIETSSACNRRCSYCPVASDPKKQEFIGDVVLDTFIYRLNELGWTGHVSLHFYNEPLLNPNIESIIGRIKTRVAKCFVGFDTNGDRLSELQVEKLVAAGIDQIRVSRHLPYGGEWDDRVLPLAKKWPNLIHITEVDDRTWFNRGGLVEKLPGKNSMKGATSCSMPQFLTVNIHGAVLLCCCDYYGTEVVGHIRHNSFREIWSSPRFEQLRRELRQGKFTTALCQACTETVQRSALESTEPAGGLSGANVNLPGAPSVDEIVSARSPGTEARQTSRRTEEQLG
jgi:MoaA/NifB/PqqE/SkfB family radical SAM enzyme